MRVQGARRIDVMPERLFDHYPAPTCAGLGDQPGQTQVVDDATKETRTDCQIEKNVLVADLVLAHSYELLAQPPIGQRIAKVPLQIADALEQFSPVALVQRLRIMLVRCKSTHRVGEVLPVGGVGHVQPVNAYQREVCWQQLGTRQVVERGYQQALG